MRNEPDMDSVIARVMSISLPLSVTALNDQAVAIVEGYGEADRVIVRRADGEDVHDVRGAGVSRVLGEADGELLAEAAGSTGGSAVIALPSLRRVADLAPREVPCLVGSWLYVVSSRDIKILAADPGSSIPDESVAAYAGGEIVPGLVQPMGTHGIAWVTMNSTVSFNTASWCTDVPQITQTALPDRPQELAVSPTGGRAALTIRGRVALVDDHQFSFIEDVTAASGLCWLDDERLCWVTRQWPDSSIVTYSTGDGRRRSEVLPGWNVGRLHRSRRQIAAIVTRHRTPPAAVVMDSPIRSNASTPKFGMVETSDGPLRTVTFDPGGPPVGLVVMLRGGPFGEWWPGWDPIVETVEERGWAAVQLESPYTAAVLGRVPTFRRNQFGVRDAALVAEAALGLSSELGIAPEGRPMAFLGHSYGAYLAASAVVAAGAPVSGLLTMNGPWTTSDLRAMGTDPASKNAALARFLQQAFSDDVAPPSPDRQASQLPKCWRVIYGTADTTASVAVIERAVQRDRPPAVLRLVNEPHVPRRRESVAETIRFIDDWLVSMEAS